MQEANVNSPNEDQRRKRIRNVVVSVIIGGLIVWFLLSKIDDPRDIPRAIGKIPIRSLLIAFFLYSISIYLKAARFKLILRTGIRLRHLFPIVSLYAFFTNILPMRAGELSYIYLLKKRAKTPGTKSFASLIVGAVADFAVILIAMCVVGWHLRDALAKGTSGFYVAVAQKAGTFVQAARGNLPLIIVSIAFLIIIAIVLLLLKRRGDSRQNIIWKYTSLLKAKTLEVGRELGNTSFDIRFLGIIICSMLIIMFRFGFQWYLVKSMGINIGIWELSFALLFGVLFSLVPVHGPAGFGTVEAPWVVILLILNISKEEAITSGFGLHIIIIMYSIIMGIFGAATLRLTHSGSIPDSPTSNV